tara:strand:- start:104 stop:289 length:186 start_codon:yes stop_codon:yes gene_type:complete
MKNIENKNIVVENFILFFVIVFFLVFNSLKTLLMIFSKGFLKKEILTTKSNLGFDMKIKIK